jgi:hypothetical protein
MPEVPPPMFPDLCLTPDCPRIEVPSLPGGGTLEGPFELTIPETEEEAEAEVAP